MEDVTKQFSVYRECVRDLWNNYFRPIAESAGDWDVRDEFEAIASDIFSSLVLHPLVIFDCKITPAWSPNPEILSKFFIVPNSEAGVPIMINRDLPRSGYWDHPVSVVKPGDVKLQLLRFFDFDQLEIRDFEFYEVFVSASPSHSEIVGRVALIDCSHAKVIFDKAKA